MKKKTTKKKYAKVKKKFPRPEAPRITQIYVGEEGLRLWEELMEKELLNIKRDE